MSFEVRQGECVELMAAMPAGSVDAVVCDPPYGLEFMGKEWDRLGDIGKVSHQGPSDRDGSTVFGRQRVAFNGSSNVRCRTCNKWKWGHKPGDGGGGGLRCQCETPDFPSPRPDQSRLMQEWHQAWATEALRVLKPGGHLLAFGGTRTYHRLVCAVEDAGFEIRDTIAYMYGSGFPKSLNVSKAIDKAQGAERELSRELLPDEDRFCAWMREYSGLTVEDARRLLGSPRFITGVVEIVNTATIEAPRMGRRAMVPTAAAWEKLRPRLATVPPEWVEALVKAPPQPQSLEDWNPGRGEGTNGSNEWAGWGTALKPAHEPVVVARKPLAGTVAGNVLEHGTGALNIDATRVEGAPPSKPQPEFNSPTGQVYGFQAGEGRNGEMSQAAGRWPANCVLSHSENCAVSSGQRPSMDEWEDAPSLCDSCAVDAGETLRRTAPGTLASTATSNAEPTTSAKDGTPPSGTSKTATGCSAGTLEAAPPSDPTAGSNSSTDVSGRTPTDPSPTGSSSTTSTVSAPTTGLRTCRLCGAEITTPSTTKAFLSDRDSQGCVSSCPVRLLDERTGERPGQHIQRRDTHIESTYFGAHKEEDVAAAYGDSGGASRFFYCAKSSRSERNAGLEGFEEQRKAQLAGAMKDGELDDVSARYLSQPMSNVHPTVKPISLMRWLVRLVTPPGGTVLDPFTGSGTTGIAAVLEGFDFVGLENKNTEAEPYVAIARARIAWWHKHRGDGEAAQILAAGEARDEVEATGQLGMFD